MSEFIDYILERKVRNLLLALALIALIPLLYMSYRNNQEKYLTEGEDVVGVFISSKGVPIRVEALKNETSEKREVLLIPRDRDGGANTNDEEVDQQKMDELMVSSSISQTTRDLNNIKREEGELMELPREGKNGAILKWTKPDIPKTYLLPIPAIPLVFLFMYRDSKDKEKQRRRKRMKY